MMMHRFDISTLQTLWGAQGLVTAFRQDAATGCIRQATLKRDLPDEAGNMRISASYVLGFPGRGHRMYPLLTLDMQVWDGSARLLRARRLGRLAPAAPMAAALMPLAQTLADARLPQRIHLAPFLPPSLLYALENAPSMTDFPEAGSEDRQCMPTASWERPIVFYQTADGLRIDLRALEVTLNLAVGERAQTVDLEPATGDYRALHLNLQAMPAGGAAFTFTLHRQGPGFARRIFEVLSLTVGPAGRDDLHTLAAFASESRLAPDALPRCLPGLAQIAAALQEKQRPADAWVLPLLSESGQRLWTRTLMESVAS